MADTLPQHLPALDGLRALAAMGVVVTHVSFQTRTGWSFAERFDYFVAVFFALSAFVLWRRRGRHTAGGYYLSRAGRILPAYWVCVVAVILLFPDARSMTWTQVLANLTSTQVFVVDGLAPGLTHLWSLCAEIAFYICLPLLVLVLGRFRFWPRVVLIAGAGLVSLGWAWLPFVRAFEEDSSGVNSQIWPPAYFLWFAVGMLAAEFEGRVPRLRSLFHHRWLWLVLAAFFMWLGSREWFGPQGLIHPSAGEFARRVAVGGAFAFCVVVPYALAPQARFLESPVMQALGRWSYGIFLWHVAVLGLCFPLLDIPVFSGNHVDFFVILLATLTLTIPLAAASYVLVEEPVRRAVRRLRRPASV